MVGVPLSCFNYTIMHIDGIDNKVVDCLSHYYENDTSDDNHSENTYVNADIRLDPDSELLPTDHYTELCACKILYILLLVDIYAQRIYLCFI